MGSNDKFSLYIHHGGKVVHSGGSILYSGGDFVGKHGFDADIFGYFDIRDAIKDLGYEEWKTIYYQVPKTSVFKEITEDQSAMQMVSHLSAKCRVFQIYVDHGVPRVYVDSGIGKTKNVDSGSGKTKDVDSGIGSSSATRLKGKHVVEDESDDSDYVFEDEGEGNSDKSDWSDDGEDIMAELRSEGDDEEYVEAMQNIRQDKLDKNVEAEAGNGRNYMVLFDPDYGSEELDSDYGCEDDVMDVSSGDEGDSILRISDKVYYDPNCNHKEMNVVLGMRFESGLQCRNALRTWAIVNGHPIHFRKASKKLLEAYCSPPCVWRCRGYLKKSEETFVITVLSVEPHTCPFDVHNKCANYKWLAKQYIEDFRVRPEMSIGEFLEDCNRRFQIQPSRGRLYRAKAYALELLRGTTKHHYSLLRNYIAELVRVDREGRFQLLVDEDSVFKGLYIGFSALKKGFMIGCRWIIGLDGCHLKTHLGGQLLCAVAHDANNQMFPLAWAVVGVENEANWTWFLSILLEELKIRDGNGVTFMSDQQKGLVNAVRELAPHAEHRNCARHVYKNWKKRHNGAILMHLFWKAVWCTYQQEWDIAMEEMKAEDQAAYDNFIERDPRKICKSFFSRVCVSDAVTNNMSETFNGTIVKARGKHIIHMLEDIRSGLRQRQFKKMEKINTVTDKICPRIRKKLEELKGWSRNCNALPGLWGVFEVIHRGDMFTVKLGERSCSCRGWELTGIPCIHGLAAIHYMKYEAADYCSHYFSVETYKKIYSFSLPALNGERMWPKAQGYLVQPPLVKTMPGRPKKKRRKDKDEKDPKNPARLRKLGIRMTCQNCLQVGHNQKGCKNAAVEKPPKGQGKRGRPRKTPVEASTTTTARPSASQQRVIDREQALSRTGIGFLQSTETGNSYLSGALVSQGRGGGQSGRERKKLATRRGGKSGSNTTTTATSSGVTNSTRNIVLSTQESQAQ